MTDCNSDQHDHNNGAEVNRIDLDWQAFCYVADELDPGERAEFEIRLEDDQQARQAVVDAVHHAQFLYSALNSTSFDDGRESVALAAQPFPAMRSSFKRSGILFTSAAALLMLVAGWAWLWNPNSIGPDSFAGSDSDQLASAWVATLVAMSDEELDEFIEEEVPLADSTDEESDDWMLVALTDLENSEEVDRETN